MRNKTIWVLVLMVLAAAGAGYAEMMKPDMVTLSGTVIDMTCSAKGRALSGKWYNAEHDDHMTPDGKKTACATMCLKGGQPAGLFDGDKITAIFGCNPRATLADYAAKDVQVMGFWGGSAADTGKTFIPMKIRADGDSSWQQVDCATMHG